MFFLTEWIICPQEIYEVYRGTWIVFIYFTKW